MIRADAKQERRIGAVALLIRPTGARLPVFPAALFDVDLERKLHVAGTNDRLHPGRQPRSSPKAGTAAPIHAAPISGISEITVQTTALTIHSRTAKKQTRT